MGEEIKLRASVVVFNGGVVLFDENGLNVNRTIVAIKIALSDSILPARVDFLAASIFSEILHQQKLHNDQCSLGICCIEEDKIDAELIIRINCVQQSIEIIRVSGKSRAKTTEVNCSFARFVELFNV